jgi:hypothetical protein
MILKSSEALQAQGIDDSVVVNYSVALINESRVKNADLIAAINNSVPQENLFVVHNVIAGASFTSESSARQVRLSEDTILSIFSETYADIVANARKKFSDFKQNPRFNGIMRRLKEDPNIKVSRSLDPRNPKSSQQNFYHKRIYAELAKFYTPRTSNAASTDLTAGAVH